MGVSVYKLEILGSRAARIYTAISSGKVTEFQVYQAVERAIDQLVGTAADNDIALQVAADEEEPEPVCHNCKRAQSLCTCGPVEP